MAERLTYSESLHRYTLSQSVGPLSFSVEAGEVVGLIGSNGSGKTTAMKMALGLLRLHEGSVTAAGDDVVYGCLPRHMSGLVDKPYFYEQLSGRDNLVMASAGRAPRLDRIDELLVEVGLSTAGRKRVEEYSQGMRQRLGIARALLGDPQYLLLDEPTNGLDPDGILWMRGLVGRLRDTGKAIVVSSHLLGELQRVSDKVVMMRAGAMVRVVQRRELLAHGADLESIYLDTSVD